MCGVGTLCANAHYRASFCLVFCQTLCFKMNNVKIANLLRNNQFCLELRFLTINHIIFFRRTTFLSSRWKTPQVYVRKPRTLCSDHFAQTLPSVQTLLSYHIIVQPRALWSDRSATQEIVPHKTVVRHKRPLIRPLCDPNPSDQTIVRPKYFVRLWCDPKFCATLVRPTLPLIRPFLNTCYNPLLIV